MIPPARSMSTAVKRPHGFMSARSGVRALMSSKSWSASGVPASRAHASRCSTAFVEPPVAMTAAIALSKFSRLSTREGRKSSLSISTARFPAAFMTSRRRCLSIAGTRELPAGEMPSASNAVAMVFAVNWPPHAPAPGHATVSSSCSSSSVIFPTACRPTAS